MYINKLLQKYLFTELGGQCRICLQSNSDQNPLIDSGCLCKGSLQKVHQYCITQEISSKFKTIPQLYQCSICKSKTQILIEQQKHKTYTIITNIMLRICIPILLLFTIRWIQTNSSWLKYKLSRINGQQLIIAAPIIFAMMMFISAVQFAHYLIIGIYTDRQHLRLKKYIWKFD